MTRYPLWLCLLALSSFLLIACETGVERSPNPGVLRVTLKANELDTTIVIRSDTTRFSRWDSFTLYLSQGRIYRGQNYSALYRTASPERIPGDTVNIIAREWLDGTPITWTDTTTITTANSRYIKYVVFESYVPPGDYDRFQMSLLGTEVDLFIPKIYQNPVQLPDSASGTMNFDVHATVNEGRTTQINLEINPFKSLRRYQDLFLFSRQVTVVSVREL